MRRLLAVIAAALAAPAPALAGDAAIVSRDVPLAGTRTLASAAPPARFDLVGLHWRGAGEVWFRTRSLAGRWSAWRPAAPEAEDRPDARSAESRARPGWKLGNPWWTGPSNRIEYRTKGDVRRLRAWFVTSPALAVPSRTLAVASAPAIVARASWRADEAIRRAQPSYADELRYAVVHHTAGSSSYTRAESAAIVRAIQLYHVKGNGWNDVGYNFLVDKYGQVFEGRFGGIDRNVVGAHAEGFNTGSVGIALLGTYTGQAPTKAAEDAIARLIAWRLDVAHVDPVSLVTAISGGNARFGAGLPVLLRAVSGHRDTGFTECPGDWLYARLAALGQSAAQTGLPKLYEPKVTGTLGSSVRFQARLSGAIPWSVTVSDALGNPFAAGSGIGPQVDWTWDSAGAPPGAYSWRIESDDPALLPASGAVGGRTGVLAITGVAADPETISPNADGVADEATLTYTLTTDATVTINVLDQLGAPVASLQRGKRRAGRHAFVFPATELPDAAYQLQVVAVGADGKQVSKSVRVLVTRTLGALEVAPERFSPNADGRLDRIAFTFALAQPADVRVRVLRDGKWVATPFKGKLQTGLQAIQWDGAKRIGRLRDGEYEAVVEATDPVATSVLRLPFLADTRAPSVRILPGLPLRVWVSEPAKLTLRLNGRSVKRTVEQPGTVTVGKRGTLRVVAWDGAGNVSAPVRR